MVALYMDCNIWLFFVHIWHATYEMIGYHMGVNQRKEIYNMKNIKKYLNDVMDFYAGFYNLNGFYNIKIWKSTSKKRVL